MMEYAAKAAASWFLGFFPLAEIYVAVPAALAMGLDFGSAVFWTVSGNFMPVPLLVVFYQRLLKLNRVGPWLSGLATPRARRILNSHGTWLILLVTPWVGVWAVAVTALALGIDKGKLLVFTFASITLYALAIAGMIVLGVQAVGL